MNGFGKQSSLRLILLPLLIFILAIVMGGNACGQSVALASPDAKDIIGDQFKNFQVDADGVITATTDRNLQLHGMRAKNFKLSGQVWLGGPSTTESVSAATAPDGFAVILRQIAGNHRYELTSRALIIKRSKSTSPSDNRVEHVADFEKPALGEWIPFSVEATPDKVTCMFGGQQGVISGPAETDGINYISLSAGTKLKYLQLEMLADSSDQTPAATTPGNNPGNVASKPPARRNSAGTSTASFLKALVIIKGNLSEGTGFIVKKNGQLCVVTNQHVLSGNSNFTVTGVDGTKYPTDGALFGAVDYDVAMLRIPAADNFIAIDDTADATAKIDDPVIVLGNAEGGDVITQTTGKVLGIGPELVEVDAKFVHGNSGSPIIDNTTHKVIGIATYVKKDYTPDELQQAANAPQLRWFGYRLDTIKQWEAIDWARFSSEADRLAEIEDRTGSLVQIFQLLTAKTPTGAHFKDSNIDVAYAGFIQEEQWAITANSQRSALSALKNLLNTLTPLLDNDTSALSDLKLYSFHSAELKNQIQIREVIRQRIQNTISNAQNMTSALDPK
jgi:hypothetical protein